MLFQSRRRAPHEYLLEEERLLNIVVERRRAENPNDFVLFHTEAKQNAFQRAIALVRNEKQLNALAVLRAAIFLSLPSPRQEQLDALLKKHEGPVSNEPEPLLTCEVCNGAGGGDSGAWTCILCWGKGDLPASLAELFKELRPILRSR